MLAIQANRLDEEVDLLSPSSAKQNVTLERRNFKYWYRAQKDKYNISGVRGTNCEVSATLNGEV